MSSPVLYVIINTVLSEMCIKYGFALLASVLLLLFIVLISDGV